MKNQDFLQNLQNDKISKKREYNYQKHKKRHLGFQTQK